MDDHYAWRLIQDARIDRRIAPTTLGDGNTQQAPILIDARGDWQIKAPVSDTAAALLDTLLPVALGGARFVIAQLGQSLDGRIATESGHSHYVTGEASRIHLHRLRALVDAVIVGAGTVAADDPQLTVRHVPGANPVRVVLDPRARLSADRRLFCDDSVPTLHVVATDAPPSPPGVERVVMPGDGATLDPAVILAMLAERGLERVLVEGGGVTISRFLDAGLLDRLHVVVAPMLIGSGRPALSLWPIERLDTALRPPCRSTPMGDDMFFDLDLRAGKM
ncbi:bifunctional deaminase-reductase-like protein [Salinisphaera sp. S4-8]|uniref:RibD family protein n=1 Tax=Salinisphaera sp. S4-8 TaxID=633357 RepID=UPI0033417396